MNEIARIEPQQAQRLSISEAMASHFNMALEPFMATMRATVFAKGMSREEEAAFLLVAKHHNLNPVTREIYAMPKKGGGIIPVVSIDGWVRMANEHHAFDGMEFSDHHDGEKLVSTTCRIYRKDRSHPIAVTEYLEECRRDTEPWKMKHRMLRHKAMIQCARYAFGFAGVYDPDEAERFAAPLGGEPEQAQRRAPSPSAAPTIEARAEALATDSTLVVDTNVSGRPRGMSSEMTAADHVVTRDGEMLKSKENPQAPAQASRRAPSPSAAPAPQPKPVEATQRAPQAASSFDPEKVRKAFADAAAKAEDRDALNEAFERIVGPHWDDEPLLGPGSPDRDELDRIYRMRASELDGGDGP